MLGAPAALAEQMAGLTHGSLGVMIADDMDLIEASQALRYRVFYEEMAAKPTPEMAQNQRDFDAFDPYTDHLLVLDKSLGDGPESVVGTYRLLRREPAMRAGQFYSVNEYDISALTALDSEILELGRSCVAEAYRTRHVMELLWRGIAAYVFHYDIAFMFGCASLPGNDLDELALPLSYLYHNHLAPPEICPVALPEHYQSMNRIPADQINRKAGLSAVPPLIKGYLRLGGVIGDGAVIDPQFNTTDVCLIVETSRVTDRYYKHYARRAGEG